MSDDDMMHMSDGLEGDELDDPEEDELEDDDHFGPIEEEDEMV